MSQRKLLQEIDRVFKKVKEGLDIFDHYYDKLQQCENQSQKEKLESDLKREIKKLQKMRDQIKSWLSGNEVKDKNQLLENRRNIENAMERFKIVEKNMKTKAYSREGLNMERNDPRQKEKDDTSEFIQQMIEELERQNEKHEANVEHIQNSGKKSRKLDTSKKQEISELQDKVERNMWHLEKLEQIQRLVMNDQLDCDFVNSMQDDIKYYVEENEDPDFLEDESLYDELKLDEIEESHGEVTELAPKEEEPESVLIDNTPKKPASSASIHLASVQQQQQQQPTQQLPPQQQQQQLPQQPQQQQQQLPQQQQPSSTIMSTPASKLSHKSLSSHTHSPHAMALSNSTAHLYSSVPLVSNLVPAVLQKQELKYASVAAGGVAHSGTNASGDNTPKTKPLTLSTGGMSSSNSSSTNLSNIQSSQQQPMTPAMSSSSILNSIAGPPGLSLTPNVGTPRDGTPTLASADLEPQQYSALFEEKEDEEDEDEEEEQQQTTETTEQVSGANDWTNTLESLKDVICKPQPYEAVSKMLDISLLNCPDSYDAEIPKRYIPAMPHPTSTSYPQEPLPELSYSYIFAKLDLSTLFFNFYYNQGDYVQLLSARELVKQGWQFDTISKKWYQRIEELIPPQLINGQIIPSNGEKRIAWRYFDYESVWLSRRMESFDASNVQFQTVF